MEMDILKCNYCGRQLSPNAKVCPRCGEPVPPKRRIGPKGALFIGLFIVITAYLYSNLLNQNNNFIDVGYYKIPSPYGSYNRIYSVYVKDFIDSPEMWEKIKEYAKSKMYSAGGNTIVFFFNDLENTPDVNLVGIEFDKKYEPYCIASFYKYPNGSEEFYKYPFK